MIDKKPTWEEKMSAEYVHVTVEPPRDPSTYRYYLFGDGMTGLARVRQDVYEWLYVPWFEWRPDHNGNVWRHVAYDGWAQEITALQAREHAHRVSLQRMRAATPEAIIDVDQGQEANRSWADKVASAHGLSVDERGIVIAEKAEDRKR